ncbi:MAG: 16S rRNA (uracil(1498)-N(3))-methyltransferase [Ruminococcus sp.]|nr:16S rRNA (uracil(1498)-N(3))-methyltransferase [Ruminococcus sp.]
MPRFFVEEQDISDKTVFIRGSDAVHIGRSLRMRLGDEVVLCCWGKDYRCVLRTISDEFCTAEVISVGDGDGEPDLRLTLFQAVPKGDKLELIVQKAVELGAARIVPVLTARCVSRPDKKSFSKKRERLARIALEAAKQCGRSIVPEVGELADFSQAAQELCRNEKALICYEKGGFPMAQAVAPGVRNVGLFIGSEGGFEQTEVDACISLGAVPIGLGKRILRCETAPLAAISIIMNLTGNM